MSLVCLAGGTSVVPLAAVVTLMWTHSVEKTAWEEVWRATPQGLVLEEARVEGSGAGMEPGPGARLEHGRWRWRPGLPPMPEIILRRSGTAGDWRICAHDDCRAAEAWLPGDPDPVALLVCP